MRRTITIIAAIILAAISSWGADLKGIRLEINSPEGIFHSGEKAVVKASMEKGGYAGALSMYVMRNGNIILEKDIKLTARPKVIFEHECNESCGVMVFVKSKEAKERTAGIGFVVDPEQLRQGYHCPDDFMEFWNGELSAMRAAEIVASFKEVPVKGEDSRDYVAYELEVSMHEGPAARGYVAMPRGARPGSLPIVMFFHGAGVSGKSCRSSIARAVEYAKKGNGAIAADINAHGMLNDQPQAYYDSLERGPLKDYRVNAPRSKRDFPYRLMYLRDVRALDFLCSLPEWDGKHVLVTGSSQGGGQSCGVAALDSRVGALVPIVPGLSDEGAGLVRECGWTRHFRAMTDNPNVRNFYPYYDSASFLRFTKAKMWMEVGLIDETCAPEGIIACFNEAACETKQLVPCPYRRHTMSSSNNGYELWNQTIFPAREKFIFNYLTR